MHGVSCRQLLTPMAVSANNGEQTCTGGAFIKWSFSLKEQQVSMKSWIEYFRHTLIVLALVGMVIAAVPCVLHMIDSAKGYSPLGAYFGKPNLVYANGLKFFAPPESDFYVIVPGNVEYYWEAYEDQSPPIETFMAARGDSVYVIVPRLRLTTPLPEWTTTVQTLRPAHVDDHWGEGNPRDTKTKLTGKGWHGTRIDLVPVGCRSHIGSVLIAIANDVPVVYELMVLNCSPQEEQAFFDSFRIANDQVPMNENDRPSWTFGEAANRLDHVAEHLGRIARLTARELVRTDREFYSFMLGAAYLPWIGGVLLVYLGWQAVIVHTNKNRQEFTYQTSDCSGGDEPSGEMLVSTVSKSDGEMVADAGNDDAGGTISDTASDSIHAA